MKKNEADRVFFMNFFAFFSFELCLDSVNGFYFTLTLFYEILYT